MNNISFTIILVSYEAPRLIARCLQSIKRYGYLGSLVQEIRVVKNSAEAIDTSDIPPHRIRVHQNETNVGFGTAVNQASQNITTSHILLLNQDAALQPRTLKSLVAFMKKAPDANVIGLKQETDKGKTLASIGNFPNAWRELAALTRISKLLPVGRLVHASGPTAFMYKKARPVQWTSGGAMVINSEMFRRVGGFDPHYFMYVEDIDLCKRVWEQNGSVWFTPDSTVWHDGQPSLTLRERAQRETVKGLIHFAQKFGNSVRATHVIENLKTRIREASL